MKSLPLNLARLAVLLPITTLISMNRTKPGHLGHHNGHLAPVPTSPNAVSSQTDKAKKRVEPWPYHGTREQTQQKILDLLGTLNNASVEQIQPDYLHVVFTSSLMSFKDDVEFYFNDDERVVHYRSQSRLGYSDMGANRARYDMLRVMYQQQ